MIITKTPFRVSLIGGGSDLEAFYKHRQGAVLSTTINKYMYISSHRFFDSDKVRIKYSKTETVNDVNAIEHPIVREVLKMFKVSGALEIGSYADVPSGTGLGSSSSFTVGLLNNMYIRSGQYVANERVAAEACKIEIEKLGEPIGKQDQYAASYGGLNVIKFNPSGVVNIEPIHLKADIYRELEDNLLIFYMGKERKSSAILAEQKRNMGEASKFKVLEKMVDLVWTLKDSLYQGDMKAFGELLHESWMLKQSLASKISNSAIDEIYECAIKSGALGGKLLGAGGGGFLLLYCEKPFQEKLRNAMKGLRELVFRFESEGSKLIYVGDEYE